MVEARQKLALFALTVLVSILLAGRAQADDRTSAAVAEKLFADGRALMAAGRVAEACPKFLESQRLDPGVGTLLNLGECYERLGRTASAWASYREAVEGARRAGSLQRADFAAARAEAVAAKLAYLTVRVQARHAGMKITLNGIDMGEPTWGTPIPVDPGRQVVEAVAKGRAPFRTQKDVGMAETVVIDVPALAEAPSPPPSTGEADRGSTRRTIGWVATGMGVVLLAAGTVLGLIAISQNNEARDQHCSTVDCDARGVSMIRDARELASLSTISFIAGGVVSAAGAVILLTAPSAHATQPTRLSLGGTGIFVGGVF